jgi:hypothetical protein
VKSSGILWIITVRPIISETLNRSVKTDKYALFLQSINGGRSPACSGCGLS